MTKQVIYRYMGTNGILETPIHLEDVYFTRLFVLTADKGKVLFNGTQVLNTVKVPEEEVSSWKEVIPRGQK